MCTQSMCLDPTGPAHRHTCPSPYHPQSCHPQEGTHPIAHVLTVMLFKGARASPAWLSRTTKCMGVGGLLNHRDEGLLWRLFCLKNVVATCKYVFRSNFITNCPNQWCLENYEASCSSLRDLDSSTCSWGSSSGKWGRGTAMVASPQDQCSLMGAPVCLVALKLPEDVDRGLGLQTLRWSQVRGPAAPTHTEPF